MECPYCKKEMELGYIQCRDRLFWTPKKHYFDIITAAFSNNNTDLTNGGNDFLRYAVYAYKCSECSKIIIDYPNESDNKQGRILSALNFMYCPIGRMISAYT